MIADGGYVLVRGTLGGEPIVILLDTGAPGLVLNQRHYTGAAVHAECIGVQGPYPCAIASVASFEWLGIVHKRADAILSDLGFLEAALGTRIDALAGLNMLDGRGITVDHDLGTITLEAEMPADEAGLVRFHYDQHLPVLTCRVNGRLVRLGLDTGSESNFLFRALDAAAVDPPIGQVRVVGLGHAEESREHVPASLQLDKSGSPIASTFIIGSSGTHVPSFAIDGLLGQSFLQGFNYTVFPSKQKLWLRPRAAQPVLVSTQMP
jgi:hypothetical protein